MKYILKSIYQDLMGLCPYFYEYRINLINENEAIYWGGRTNDGCLPTVSEDHISMPSRKQGETI